MPVPDVPVVWDEDTLKNLTIDFAPRADNTNEFTRTEVRSKVPRRYYDVKLSFEWNGKTSSYLKADDGIIPYVPPRPPRNNRKGAPPQNNYGRSFVYASLPRGLLDRIINEAANHGYRVHPGDPKMPSNDDDWWVTLNISQGAHVKMERKKGAGHTDASLSRIFMASKLGVAANLVLSLKLKCSVDEAVKEDGTYYDFDEASPAVPDEDTIWTLTSSAAAIYITDVGVDVAPPVRETGSAAAVPASFATTEADSAADDMEEKLKKLGI